MTITKGVQKQAMAVWEDLLLMMQLLKKNVITVGFYPYNPTIADNFMISIGAEMSFFISSSSSGTYNGWASSQPLHGSTAWSGELNDGAENVKNKPTTGALALNFSYKISIKDRYFLVPSYNLHCTIGREFRDGPLKSVSSLRQLIAIGVKRNIIKNSESERK